MFLKTFCVTFVAGSLALAVSAPADIVGFPEKNPVFTVEVPKDAKVKWEGDQLRIFPAKHQGDVSFSALPDKVHDDASARAWLAEVLSIHTLNYSGLDRPPALPVPEKRAPIGSGAHGFAAEGPAGNYVWINKTNEQVQPEYYFEAVFTLDDKKYFSIHSDDNVQLETLLYGSNGQLEFYSERNRIVDSIKPVK